MKDFNAVGLSTEIPIHVFPLLSSLYGQNDDMLDLKCNKFLQPQVRLE